MREGTAMTDLEMTAFAEQVADNAHHIFGPRASAAILDQYAREAVLDLWMNGSAITLHATEMALQQVRDLLAATPDAVPAPPVAA